MPLLTFDDGPSEWTPAILDLLAEANERAVFFVTGQHIAGREAILERAHSEGHELGVHGWTHRRLTKLSDLEVACELGDTLEELIEVTDATPIRFRAPYFDTDERVNQIAAGLGLAHMGASVIPDDWLADDPEALAAIVLAELKPDSIVSLHDGIPPNASENCTRSREVTVEAVRLILAAMKAMA